MKTSASIVLFKNSREILLPAIASFLNFSQNYDSNLYLIDNSPSNDLKDIIDHERVTYIFNPSNPGFGDGHNIAIREAQKWGSDYHFVINPDVKATEDVISPMIDYMEEHKDVGMMMPRILNFDGTTQNLPKLLPSPYTVVMRKVKKPSFIYNDFIRNYELRDIPDDLVYEIPIISGCFTLFRMTALSKVGLYDDKFFMYFEDWDISRRMHQKYKTIYFPKVSIYHGYESGANKNIHLFKIFVRSAITYFNKWGWLMDGERKNINRITLEQFK